MAKFKYKIYIRSITAIIMLVVWTLVSLSGLILWFAPEGQRAGRIPLLFDITKSDWKEVHLWLAVIMVVITIVHVIIDWKTLKAVIKYMVSVHQNATISSK